MEDSAQHMVAPLIAMVQNSPTWLSCIVLFFGAFVEYVFPPFPGDTILVAGGFFMSRGAIPFVPSMLALMSGSVIGSGAGWAIGYYATAHESTRKWVVRVVGADNLERLTQIYARYGAWILLANRFIPGIRGIFMMAAGVAKIPVGRVMLFGGLSAAIWNTFLIALGYFVSKSLENLLSLFESYTHIMIGVVVVLLLAFVIFRLKRSRK
jgi:membrane-associated protein